VGFSGRRKTKDVKVGALSAVIWRKRPIAQCASLSGGRQEAACGGDTSEEAHLASPPGNFDRDQKPGPGEGPDRSCFYDRASAALPIGRWQRPRRGPSAGQDQPSIR
jgi:hypothetical protein